MVSAFAIPAVSGLATAQTVPSMLVDVPPVIRSDQRGEVVAAVYPGGDMNPDEVIGHGDFRGFKLGPLRNGEDEVNERGADSVRHRLLPTGNLGVFFDSSTADDWFSPGDDEAKLSAPGVAWGADEVSVR